MKKALSYIVPFVVCAAGVFAVMGIQDTFSASGQKLIGNLSNAFSVPGIIMLCFGLLVFATNDGAFDMLVYSVIRLFDLFRRDMSKSKYRTFYDYRQAQKDRQRPFVALVIVGGAYLLVGIALLLAYHYAF